ncbi:hypothetical protein ABL78_8434, partial [Leptomonas seymouri]
MKGPQHKRIKGDDAAMSSVIPPSQKPLRSPMNLFNYRCKQKQYHSVLWSLQFLSALLRHRPTADGGEACSQGHAAPSGATCRSRYQNLSSAPNANCLNEAILQFLVAAEGGDASFGVEGPLSVTQLLSLQRSFTDDQVRALCVECLGAYVQKLQQRRRVSPRMQFTHDTIFSEPTERLRTMWPTPEFCSHYANALAEAHRGRINHSDLLALPGYLQEAGLHAERVFTGKTSIHEPSQFTDPSELRAAEEWRRLIRL